MIMRNTSRNMKLLLNKPKQHFLKIHNHIFFYKKINELVKYDPNVKLREIGTCDLIIYGAAEELSIYMDISKPSNTINQEKPDYSNLTNAVGIFSSRNTTLKQGIKLNQYTIKMFGFSEHTSSLNFCDPEPSPQTIPCN